MNGWHFSVRLGILGNFDGALRRDINSVTRGAISGYDPAYNFFLQGYNIMHQTM